MHSGQPVIHHSIEIWSDIACPFCYIGKRRLKQALDASGMGDSVQLKWRSFLLNPGLKTDPELRLSDHLAAEKGWDADRISAIFGQLTESGAASGIAFRFDQVVVANTRRAHLLWQGSVAYGASDALMEGLFNAYFCEGRNIDDLDVLNDLAKGAGLTEDQVHEALHAGTSATQMESDIREASHLGVQGVPFFVFNRKFAVSGAQPVEVFRQALSEAAC